MGKIVPLFLFACLLNSFKAASQLRLPANADTINHSVSLKVLPRNFYIQHLSFFCKKEVQLQKLTSLPVFFRVGSKDYVDYLERKPNAVLRSNQ